MLAALGSATLLLLERLGGISQVATRLAQALLRGRMDRREFVRSLWAFGNESLPIVAATAAFAGLIMVLQAAFYVRQYGAYDLVGWFAGFSVLRELGPVLIGLMFSGRVGASNTTELATLTATEKVDALRILCLDIYEVIVLPRSMSMIIALVALLLWGDAVALGSAALGAHALLGVDFGQFWRGLHARLGMHDLFVGMVKAAFFGTSLAVISTYFGLAHRGPASTVGRAVYAQVVTSALCLFVVDYLVSLGMG